MGKILKLSSGKIFRLKFGQHLAADVLLNLGRESKATGCPRKKSLDAFELELESLKV